MKTRFFIPSFCLLFFLVGFCSFFLNACVLYSIGYRHHSLPGNYKKVAVFLFKNDTQEVGLETDFTHALIRQFKRSQVVKVVGLSSALVFLEGSIINVTYKPKSFIEPLRLPDGRLSLPSSTVLVSSYDVIIHLNLKLIQKENQKVIWETRMKEESSYHSPQIGMERINSSNALYNHSARRDKIKEMAENMMTKAHDLMMERF